MQEDQPVERPFKKIWRVAEGCLVCSRGQVKVCCKYILLTCPLKRKSRRKAEKIDGAEHLCVVYTSIYAYYTIMYKHTYTTQWHTFMDWLLLVPTYLFTYLTYLFRDLPNLQDAFWKDSGERHTDII